MCVVGYSAEKKVKKCLFNLVIDNGVVMNVLLAHFRWNESLVIRLSI